MIAVKCVLLHQCRKLQGMMTMVAIEHSYSSLKLFQSPRGQFLQSHLVNSVGLVDWPWSPCVLEEKVIRRGGTQDAHRSLCFYSMAGIPYEGLRSMGSGHGAQVHSPRLPSAFLAMPAKSQLG